MALHVYCCERHGEFEVWKAMGQDDVGSHPCPEKKCKRTAPKVWRGDTTGVTEQRYKPHYCEQLGAQLDCKQDERRRIQEIKAESDGDINLDWH